MHPVLQKIEKQKLIAVIRSSSAADARAMINAAMHGGFTIFEISLQNPQVMKLIKEFSQKKNILIGAGTVTDGEMAQRAIHAGAAFVSSPYTDLDVIAVAKNNNIFVIQGAMTPTEIVNAYKEGTDLVMVYPVTPCGGPQYLRSIRKALPSCKFMVSGGVDLESVFQYLKESVAVGVKQSLFETPLVRNDNWKEITAKAKKFNQRLVTVKAGR